MVPRYCLQYPPLLEEAFSTQELNSTLPTLQGILADLDYRIHSGTVH